jgi:phosphoglycerate-specific signal transduction histidine kinase
LEDIRREQQYQREREADYRDLSEATNARAVWYSIAQIVVLVATCTWQLRHLKVRSCLAHFPRVLTSFVSRDFSRIER